MKLLKSIWENWLIVPFAALNPKARCVKRYQRRHRLLNDRKCEAAFFSNRHPSTLPLLRKTSSEACIQFGEEPKKVWVLFWVLFGSKSFEMIQNTCKRTQRVMPFILLQFKEFGRV